jgi:hypothetical protein
MLAQVSRLRSEAHFAIYIDNFGVRDEWNTR